MKHKENKMKKISILTLVCASLIFSSLHAEEQTAEQLVSSKTKADMNYRQLMEIMGSSSSMIHEGILRENKQMVKTGANFIFTHPAPNHKPWDIMKKEDQSDFKKSLLAFDKILDIHTENVVASADKENWSDAGNAAHELTNACISCHVLWKNKVK